MKKNILVVITVLILSLSMLSILKMNVTKADYPWTLSDSKLSLFQGEWGGTATVTDLSPGVQFVFSGLSTGGSGFGYKMDWGFGSTADWGGFPDGDSHYNNFTPYTGLKLLVTNTGSSTLTMCLYINTGFTGGGQAYDTFWQGDWTDVPAGQSRVLTIDFTSATEYKNYVDPEPAYQHPNGWRGPIFRLDQVTNVGLQALRNPVGDGSGTIIVYGYTMPTLYIDPSPVQKTYADVGHTFNVTVKIGAVTDLFGFDINITWDNSLITFVTADYGSYMDTLWGSGNWVPTMHTTGIDDLGEGTYKFVAVSTLAGFSTLGNQAILNLTFLVVDPLTNSMRTTPLHFYTDKLSDSNAQPILHTTEDGSYQIWGKTPTLSMTNSTGGNSRTCREHSEPFNVILGISDAASVTGVNFEIHYDQNMISVMTLSRGWGAGTITDNGNGIITGALTGSGPASTFANITFEANSVFNRTWRDPSTGQASNLFASSIGIYLQSATLHYPSAQPDLSYIRSESLSHKINPPSDFSYTFYPIKGDLNNDGHVNIDDLTAIASRYDTYDANYNLVGSDTLVDIFDLVVVASNFWFTYTPPAP